jgi:hypothetical protein
MWQRGKLGDVLDPAKASHLWEMTVRTFRPVQGAVVVLLLLLFCADSEAGRFCRQQRCGNNCCAIPCWVRWFDSCSYGSYGSYVYATCSSIPGYTCYCCEGQQTIQCGSGPCNAGSCVWVQVGSNWTPNCGAPGGRGFAFQGSTTGCERAYAMVCDPCCHVLRFALPWECPLVWGPLCLLGSPC